MKTQLILGAAVLALAGCGGPGRDGAAEGGNGSAAAEAGRSGGPEPGTGLEPGEWEIATESANKDGAPDLGAAIFGKANSEKNAGKAFVAAVRSVNRQCLTPRKAAELFAGDPGEGCRREGLGWRDGRIATKVSCTDDEPPQKSVHEVNGRYSARSFEVTQRLMETSDGETMTMTTRDSGRRLGDCPAAR